MAVRTSQQSRNSVIALNVLLLAILAAVSLVPSSSGQLDSTTNPHIDSTANQYVAIPSVANGIPTGAIYIMETTRQELVAIAWNRDQNRVRILGYRNLRIDADSVPRR
jgi:hypothetical protein